MSGSHFLVHRAMQVKIRRNKSSFCKFGLKFVLMQICIDSIFSDRQDVDVCISHAADSVGLKELPSYEVRVGEQYDWIKKTQVEFASVELFHIYI